MVGGFAQGAAPDPLPELTLRRPEPFLVLTDDLCRALALLRRFGGRRGRVGAHSFRLPLVGLERIHFSLKCRAFEAPLSTRPTVDTILLWQERRL